MTLGELKKIDSDFITANIAAQILKCDPHYIRVQAHQDKSMLGFPVNIMKRRVKIPRIGFIKFVEGATTYG